MFSGATLPGIKSEAAAAGEGGASGPSGADGTTEAESSAKRKAAADAAVEVKGPAPKRARVKAGGESKGEGSEGWKGGAWGAGCVCEGGGRGLRDRLGLGVAFTGGLGVHF